MNGRKMKHRLIACLLACVAFSGSACAGESPLPLPAGCGSGNIINGLGYLTEDLAGRLCDSGGAGYAYTHISTNATTAIKTGAGALHSISINTKGASSNIATVYDNTAGSGTVIAVVDTTSNVQTVLYDIAFSTGLTVVTSAGTAADITVSSK